MCKLYYRKKELNDGKEIDCVDIQNESHRDNGNISDNENLMNDVQKRPRIKYYVKYKTLCSNQFFKSQVINRAGKASGKYPNWFNLRNIDNDTVTSIEWKTVEKWKPSSKGEVLLSSHKDISRSDLITAKLKELEKWKTHNVYDTADNENQEFITLRWINSEKYVNGKLKVKSRLVARRFQEYNSDFLSYSPTCSKETYS